MRVNTVQLYHRERFGLINSQFATLHDIGYVNKVPLKIHGIGFSFLFFCILIRLIQEFNWTT